MLVVDDDEISRASAAGLLQSLGLAVDLAVDGREALQISVERPYAAIFMDCEMPEVDGYTAVAQLRRREGASRHTPVIAVTARSRSVSVAAGMDHHIAKPVQLGELRADCVQLGLIASERVVSNTLAADPRLDTPLLDPSVFGATAAGDREPKATEVLTFIEQATVRLPEIWRAANAGDTATLRRLALALKPRAERVGAARISVLCDDLSEAAARQSTAFAVSIEEPLRRAFGDTRAAIRAWVDGRDSPPDSKMQLRSPIDAPTSSGVSALLPFGPVRVVLADDDPLARAAIGAMLKTADWIELVDEASGVHEIVDLVAAEQPDVVLLDWMMPGGGGGEAAHRILDRSPETLIVGVTSSDGPEALTQMTSAGAACLISKSATAEQLTQTIARSLMASRATQAAGGENQVEPPPTDRASNLESTSQGTGGLDPSGVERLRNEFGSTGILGELVDLFGAQTPERLTQLQHAIQTGDAAKVSGLAHQLKGGALTLAANHMAELCDGLDGAARAGSLEGAGPRVERIRIAFEHAYAALRREFT